MVRGMRNHQPPSIVISHRQLTWTRAAALGVQSIMQVLDTAGGEVKSAHHLASHFEAMIDAYGFEFYRLTLQRRAVGEDEVILAHRWPRQWAELYRSKKYSTVDPAARLLRLAHRPYRLRDAAFCLRSQPNRSRLQRMIQDAARHGMKDGYVFPIHGRTGLMGSLLVSGKPG